MSLYVRTGKRHAVGLPWWFVPFYAFGWLAVATLVAVVWLVAACAVVLWTLAARLIDPPTQ